MLLSVIHKYKAAFEKLEAVCRAHPDRWRESLPEVTELLNRIFLACGEFETAHREDEARVYRMKRFFVRRFRKHLRQGQYNRWVMDIPYGYHGDFRIIDDIYRQKAEGDGFGRCLDEYFLASPAAQAIRLRKQDFKHFLRDELVPRSGARALDLGAGPCRIPAELMAENPALKTKVEFDLLDHDPRAAEYGRQLLKDMGADPPVHFLKRNAMRLAVTRDITKFLPQTYNIIYSTGLFDYLDAGIAVSLLTNLKTCLQPGGVMLISNYAEKERNPSRLFMEWGGDWELIYRAPETFLDLFLKAGFAREDLEIRREEKLGMMLTVIARLCSTS